MKTTEELYQYIIGKIRHNMTLRKQYGDDNTLVLRNSAKITGMIDMFEFATGQTIASYQIQHTTKEE